jgi:hypothetical protein
VVDRHIVLTAEAERFERRLTEEISGLRTELHDQIAGVRTELHDQIAAVRGEIAALRVEMHAMRADILKWSFLFWIGQVVTMTALISFLLRAR